MATQLTNDELLRVLQTALETFRTEVDTDINAPKILTLLAVARNSGMPQIEMGDHVKGVTTSSASRYLQDWSELDKNRQPGMDYITARPDPQYRRRSLIYITPKGQQFIERLTAAVNKVLAGAAGRRAQH
jgi:DNA-binding MarR family transcriptional regulator